MSGERILLVGLAFAIHFEGQAFALSDGYGKVLGADFPACFV